MIQKVIFDVGGTLVGAPDLFRALSGLFPGADAYDGLKAAFLREYGAIADGQRPFAAMKEMISDTLRAVSAELGRRGRAGQSGLPY